MADAKTPIVRQMSVAPTASAPSQSTGNSGPSGSGGSEHTKTPQVKLIHYEKATQFETIFHLFWQNSCLYSVVSKQVEEFFKVLWPFQKSWTLRPIFSWKPTFENGLHVLLLLQHFNGLAQEVHEVQNVALKMFTSSNVLLWPHFFSLEASLYTNVREVLKKRIEKIGHNFRK